MAKGKASVVWGAKRILGHSEANEGGFEMNARKGQLEPVTLINNAGIDALLTELTRDPASWDTETIRGLTLCLVLRLQLAENIDNASEDAKAYYAQIEKLPPYPIAREIKGAGLIWVRQAGKEVRK